MAELEDSSPTVRVSVVIPAHNARNTIERALRSVAAQSLAPFEVIIVDDASVDGTDEIARKFPGLPIHVERLERQSGASTARNRGIDISRGEFIAFLDADDEWLPQKTERQVAVLQADTTLSFVCCEADVVAPDGRVTQVLNANPPRPNGDEAWKTLLRYPCVGTPCVMARRDLLRDVGGFNPSLPIGEDQDLWIRLALCGPVRHLDQSLVRVHFQTNSLSAQYRGIAKSTTLPMVIAHVNELRHRLSRGEIDAILGTRYTQVGRSCYETGNVTAGLKLIVSAMLRGERPVENLIYLVSASPSARLVKRLIGYRSDHGHAIKAAELADDSPPLLTVAVDTEEEYDWANPFDRAARGVTAIEHLPLAQQLCERFGIVPAYMVDYLIAADENAVATLKGWVQSRRAVVGAQLQPWVNPPFEEAEALINTYPGNLPYSLQYCKLKGLTDLVTARFGERPIIFKAGRSGLGPATAKILKSLGYEIDVSVLPLTNLSYGGGPDFSYFPNAPFWSSEEPDIFEAPQTRGVVGPLRRLGAAMPSIIDHPLANKLGLVGGLGQLGLLRRLSLTPEGMTLDEQKRLTRMLLKEGCKVFTYTYHSTSLLPGATPFVRTPSDRDRFLEKMERYFEFFLQEVGGRPATLVDIRDRHRGRAQPAELRADPVFQTAPASVRKSS